MTDYISDKIKVLSLVAIVLVLYIHSGFHDYPHEILGMQFNHYLQDAISGKLGRCAVPLFYMISGFLFFQHVDAVSDVLGKMRKRVKALLVPYIIGALFFPLFCLLVEHVPFAAKMSNGSGTSDELTKPLLDVLLALFYMKPGGNTPWAFHLWFLRDLIIIVACSPLLFYMRKYMRGDVTCLFFLILSFAGITSVQFLSFFWFMAGDAFLGRMDKTKSWGWPIVYVFICIAEMCWSPEWMSYLNVLSISIGILAVWSVYDLVLKGNFVLRNHRWLAMASSFTFFIYLFHEPTLNIVRKLLIFPLGTSSLGFAVNYLISPWVFALLFIGLGWLLRKYMPKVYGVCVGGR